MALNWGCVFLSCVVVAFISVLGATVRNCDSGPRACRGATVLSSDGQGNTICCPAGFALSQRVLSINGVTSRKCNCTQGSDNSSSSSRVEEVFSSSSTSNSSSESGHHWENLQNLFHDVFGNVF